MQHTLDLLKQYWPILLSGYALNTLASYLVRIPKSNNVFWLVVKFLHGVLDKIDPPDADAVKKATIGSLAVFCVLMATGCVNAKWLTAKSSDGKDWATCVEFTEDASLKLWQLACVDVTMPLAELEAKTVSEHPKALMVREVQR